VRTLDAIHLASALVLRQSFPDLVVVSADERMRANATLLGSGPTPNGGDDGRLVDPLPHTKLPFDRT
jgi:hypothetical protein